MPSFATEIPIKRVEEEHESPSSKSKAREPQLLKETQDIDPYKSDCPNIMN